MVSRTRSFPHVIIAKPVHNLCSGFSFLFHLYSGIFFINITHVVADYVSFATTFLLKSHRLTHAVAPPFRKKSRSARLFGCKRPHDGSLSLPTFCELRGFNSHLRKRKNIFFMWLKQSVQIRTLCFS